MIAILYPLKMEDNLSKAYSAIYEISADLATKAAKGAEKKRAESAKAGDTEGAKKAMAQNTKFYNYAREKRQKENAPKKPTGPMVNKPSPDPNSSYPGTPQVMKQGKIVKSSYEPEGEMVEEKKPLPKTKMYRKAGNLSRTALSKGLDSKEGSKAQKRSEKIVSTISTADEKKRFDNMKTKKSELYNDTTGKFRKEWEALKLIETENYREKFDTWLEGIVEEGYEVERWSDEELIDTFINENNLWASREAVDSALLEADKKGSGSGKKDACYKKVKASASVWPSAYASGRLVQCRKKGAANYGNSSKKEDFSDWRDEIGLLDEDKKMSDKFYAIAKRKGEQRRNSYEYRKKGSFGVGKNERAAYNLSQASVSRNKDLDSQGGPQTGGGSKSFGYASNKKNPIKSKSVGDTGAIGHRKNRDEKITTKKDGKTPLKTPRYKLNMGQRVDHHSSRRFELKNPDKNPKHEANKK